MNYRAFVDEFMGLHKNKLIPDKIKTRFVASIHKQDLFVCEDIIKIVLFR